MSVCLGHSNRNVQHDQEVSDESLNLMILPTFDRFDKKFVRGSDVSSTVKKMTNLSAYHVQAA